MNETIRLGRIAGVRVGMNWSLLLIFGLISWGLATQWLPLGYPGYETALYWGTGIATAICFFGSLVAHELGHALAARRDGLGVEGITLWLFGGVAKLRGDVPSPTSELRIALLGPLVSVACAGLFAGNAYVLGRIDGPPLVTGMLSWLWRINLILVAFNLLPAFPLDGGRVLRAWLWRTRARERATSLAAGIGKGLALALVALGILDFALRDRLSGSWMVFIGSFLFVAARGEEAHVLIRGALEEVRVEDVMTRHPVTVASRAKVNHFLSEMASRHHYAAYPVVESDGSPGGWIEVSDAGAVPNGERGDVRLKDVATPLDRAAIASTSEPIVSVIERLSGVTPKRAIVVEEDTIVGIVTQNDLNRAIDAAALGEQMVNRPNEIDG